MSEEFAAFMPHIRRRWEMEQLGWQQKREQAWIEAKRIAAWLREEFKVTEVIVFGSLLERGPFDDRSDIDLAIRGLAFSDYLKALARVSAVSPEFDVDIVDLDDCSPALRQIVLRSGVRL